MNYNNRDLERIARNISLLIEENLIQAGIFYRIFYRCKGNKSLASKLSTKLKDGKDKYDSQNKLLRDLIGVRINLYFLDDLEILKKFIKEKYSDVFIEETIDLNNTTEFKPTRINLIYKIPEEYNAEFREIVNDSRIDLTFELQLRTIFSEGWHEVEHDFRYKCLDDWEIYPELSRTLNGILASLETNEWSIIQLFERLSYSHYKKGDISAMIRTKLRVRLEDLEITEGLLQTINNNEEFSKDFFKLDRSLLINRLLRNKRYFPQNLDNVIYFINFFFIKNENILKITPQVLREDFSLNT